MDIAMTREVSQAAFIRNIWYVVAWSSDVVDQPIGCSLIGEPIVLYRRADGTVVALEDRCPHRHAALSMGRVEGDELRCMYHGLKFAPGGQCVHVPGMEAPPANVAVRTYPVVEKDGWLWLWPGDPEQADPALIPQAWGIVNDRYTMRSGSLDYAADYQLINDNLTDLSHLDFVHETTLGAASGARWSEVQARVVSLDRGVHITRWFPNIPGNAPGRTVDSWNSCYYWLPGIFIFKVSIYPPGTAEALGGGAPEGVEAIFERVEQQAVTPMAVGHTRYLFASGFQAGKIPPEALEPAFQTILDAFAEDKAMIERQQKIWDMTPPDTGKLFIPQDKAPAIFRKMVARKIAEERLVPDAV